MDLSHIKIETDRLMLVPLSMEYEKIIFREFQEPVTKFMDPKAPQKIEETEEFIRTTLENMQKGKELVLVILDKQSGEFLGEAGLHQLDKKILEMGIWIKQSAHGQKYGREAMQALKLWADKHTKYEFIRYPVAAENISSRKIAEALGGKIVKEYRKTTQSGRTYDYVEYRILKVV